MGSDISPGRIFDPESELAILAAAHLDPTTFDRVGTIVSATDFGDRQIGCLWDLLATLYEAKQPSSDWIVLKQHLTKLPIDDEMKQPLWWAKLWENSPAKFHGVHYANRIRDFADRRKLFEIAQGIHGRIDAGETSEETIAWLEQRQAAMQSRGTFEADTLLTIMEERVKFLNQIRANGCGGLMTGIIEIDDILGGMFPGEMTVLAARPSNGKTAFAMQVAEHNAEHGRPVLFVSLEMTKAELGQRMICGRSRIDNSSVRSASVDDADVAEMVAAAKGLAGLPLFIWDRAGTTLSMIRGLSRLHASRNGIKLIVVDFMRRVKWSNAKMDLREHVSEVSNGLKDLAKELNVPTLAISQLNREAEGVVPSLAMLAESGNIEQDADTVVFLHRDRERPETKFIIAKNRHGQTGKLDLHFDGKRTRFEGSPPAETRSNYSPAFAAHNSGDF